MKYISLIILVGWANLALAEVRWFVLEELVPDSGLSFLLPLSDPDHIAQARVLVAQGPDNGVGTIASAQAVAGSDGFNRDLNDPAQPSWSWHVTQFEGFADLTIELCDGNPQLVEDDVDGFLANTDGRICFWGYVITAELDEAPEYRFGLEDRGAWFDPEAPGQGVLLDIAEEGSPLFIAWFTFDPGSAASAQRWFTLQEIDDQLLIFDSTGGRFNDPAPVATREIGAAEVRFEHCNAMTIDYVFETDSLESSGQLDLERLLPRTNCQPDDVAD